MKKVLFLLMFPVLCFGQYTSIPDSMFEQRLIDLGYDTIHDGQVLTADIVNIDTLFLENPQIQGSFSFTYGPISDLTGIEDFLNLTYLDCSGGNLIDSLDFSQNPTLTYLNCSGWWIFRHLLSLNISQNTALSHLNCNSSLLSVLDLSQNPNLTFLNCRDNELQILDLSQNIGLVNLDCGRDEWLQTLYSGNPVTHLTNLDLSQNINLTSLNCSGNALSSLDLSQNINLTSLNCADNQLQILDLSQNIGLVNLDCGNDIWESFDNTNQLTNLDLSQNINLTSINCYGNSLSNLDLRNGNNTNIGFFNSVNNDSLYCISVDDSSWATANLTIPNQTIFSNNCNNLQYTLIPDSIFEQRLIDLGYDNIHNGQVLTANISNIDSLDISANSNEGIDNLTGIEDFSALTYLNCSFNKLTNLDVTNNTALTYLNCSFQHFFSSNIGLNNLNLSQNNLLETLICDGNPLTTLDVSNNTALTYLSCGDNDQLTSFDISNNTALTFLNCRGLQQINPSLIGGLTSLDLSQNNNLDTLICDLNQLTSLDVSNNNALTYLNCSRNNLTSLDVSQNPNLTSLYCWSNQLNILDVSQNTSLKILSCSFNNLTSLDLTQNSVLTYFFCSYNSLMSLDLRNGNNINFTGFNATNNDSLNCISVDDSAWSANNWTDIDSHTSFSNDCNPSSVEIIEIEKNLSIYPNPARENITISINNFNGKIRTEVFDVIGNRLQNSNETTISLLGYVKGIYILKVTYDDRVVEIKVIKD